MARRRQRISKPKPDPTVMLALSIVPAVQVANGRFELCDVANHSVDDQRDMVSLKRTRTIRRQPKIDELVVRKVISEREGLACEWYRAAHEEMYETRIRISDWEATAASTNKAYGHWPHDEPLEAGMNMFEYAREAINPFFRPMFDRVVLHGRPLGKLGISFRTAARELLARIEDMVAL